MFSFMGGKDPNRQPKLSGLKITPLGSIRMLKCDHCRRLAPIPIEQLIRKHGPNALVEFASAAVRCSGCKGVGARAVMLRLCDPDCPRQRG
jgi:hypothetical protein